VNNVLAVVIILLGGLFVTVGISGNYTGLFSLVGITLPGTDTLGNQQTKQAGPHIT
jgi:hypothetical protein